jgi:hypothetical protein
VCGATLAAAIAGADARAGCQGKGVELGTCCGWPAAWGCDA